MSTPSGRHRTVSDDASTWTLQDAKARLSELLRRARIDGPQHVTVHGREEAVVLSAEEFRRLKGSVSGQALIDALQACPYPGLDLDLESVRTEARDVDL
nr:type II toxin-antitoxin system Phd/YefM family antitoxin [uncultured Rhodopila sp.]